MVFATSRKLAPAYLFYGNAIVWRCNCCLKMFFVSLTEAQSPDVPRHIWTEFTAHFCATPKVLPPSADQNRECGIITITGERTNRD
jgi:hypothetical protein